jgi:N-acetyl-anhydromuramyl-L-alanine amidase AmpD
MNISKKFAAPCYRIERPKTAIVLHFTAGSTVSGAVASWQQNFAAKQWPLGTPYIIDRDGTIYEVFSPKHWANHIGAPAAQEQRTIGIELVNWGPLTPNGGGYSPWIKSVSVPAEDVGSAVYRGARYWQKFPRLQAKATAELVKKLCKDFAIPAVIPPAEKRGIFAPQWASMWRGVCDHTNFREDKYDMGPMWDWSEFAKDIA